MPVITEEQKNRIIALLDSGGVTREQIASQVGVSPGTVSAVKANITMGTYKGSVASDSETQELIEASETTFGLERDLQSALRANIEQLEPGLRIVDDGKEHITDAGRIDITDKDTDGVVVVIEVKAGTAAPEALTQLSAYGCVGHRQRNPSPGHSRGRRLSPACRVWGARSPQCPTPQVSVQIQFRADQVNVPNRRSRIISA
jgi:transposase-like protein